MYYIELWICLNNPIRSPLWRPHFRPRPHPPKMNTLTSVLKLPSKVEQNVVLTPFCSRLLELKINRRFPKKYYSWQTYHDSSRKRCILDSGLYDWLSIASCWISCDCRHVVEGQDSKLKTFKHESPKLELHYLTTSFTLTIGLRFSCLGIFLESCKIVLTYRILLNVPYQ